MSEETKDKSTKDVASQTKEQKPIENSTDTIQSIQAPQSQSQQPAQGATPPKKKHTCCLAIVIFIIVVGAMIGTYIFLVINAEKKSTVKTKSQNVTYNMPNVSLVKTKNYKVAGIFIEIPGNPMPNEFIDTLCNSDQTDSRSYYHTPYWLKYQAANYGVDFNMEFKCIKKKIRVPDYFIAKTEKYITCADGSKVKNHFDHFLEFNDWLRENYPELSGYDYLVETIYYGKDYNCPSHGSASAFTEQKTIYVDIRQMFELEEAKTLFGEETGQKALYEPPLGSTRYPLAFAHEFLHLIGAVDKYLGWDQKKQSPNRCATDKATGVVYDAKEIMCGGTQYGVRDAKASEQTAREVDWIQ